MRPLEKGLSVLGNTWGLDCNAWGLLGKDNWVGLAGEWEVGVLKGDLGFRGVVLGVRSEDSDG